MVVAEFLCNEINDAFCTTLVANYSYLTENQNPSQVVRVLRAWVWPDAVESGVSLPQEKFCRRSKEHSKVL